MTANVSRKRPNTQTSIGKLRHATALSAPLLSLLGAALFSHGAFADPGATQTPYGGNVVGGSATISSPSTGVLDINQSSDRSIINWQSFDTGVNATVNVNQPNSSSWNVNRVVGAKTDPTMFLGALNSNGQVIILDRNGVLFGKDSRIDVGGIIASTGDLADPQGFMNGASSITLNNFGDGKVENKGMISVAEGGLAALVAPQVANSGIITAKMGKVDLAAGNTEATVDFYGDGLFEFAVTDDAKKAVVENSGVIDAQNGVIAMTTGGAKAVVDSTINMSGVAKAQSVTVEGDDIVLGGTVDASNNDHANVKVIAKNNTDFKGQIKTGKNSNVEVSGNTLSLGGTFEAGEGTHILFDPVTFVIESGDAATLVSSLNSGGTVDVEADKIIVNAAINSSAQSSNATLNFKDHNSDGDLVVNLNDKITLGSNQYLTGDAVRVNVAATGLIQNGVDVATAAGGALVNVAAGNYTEQVNIDKDLILRGAGAGLTTVTAPTTLADSFADPLTGGSDSRAVIYVHDTDNAVVQNLTVDGASHGDTVGGNFIGIGYYNAGGAIRNAEIKDIKNPGDSGIQSGYGVLAYSDDAGSHSVDVRNSTISGFQKNGIVYWGNGQSGTILGNTVTGAGAIDYIAQNGVILRDGATGTVSSNTISGIGYTGPNSAVDLFLYNAGDGATISNNIVTGTGVDNGIYASNSNNARIIGNTVSGSEYGLEIDDSNGAFLNNNTFSNNTYGIDLYNATNSDVRNNTLEGNTDTGLWVEGTGTVSNLTGNQFKDNGQHIVYTNGAGGTLNAGDGNTYFVNGAYKRTVDMTNDELFTLEDMVTHKLDDAANGLVLFKNNNLYVTADSGSIQRGVDAASAGYTVNVGAGNFTEQVDINKDLTLKGSGQGVTTITSPTTMAGAFANPLTGGSDSHAIVYAHGADNIDVSDLSVDGASHGDTVGGNFIGIGYYNAGGDVRNVTIQNIKNPGNSGIQSGYGVLAYSDDAGSHTLNLRTSDISAFQKNGIVYWGNGLSGTISANTVTGAGEIDYIAQNGIILRDGATGTIAGNHISGIGYDGPNAAVGLFLYNAGDGAVVRNNVVTGTGVDNGIYASNSNNAQISNNNVNGSEYGIEIDDSDGTLLDGNTVRNGTYGIDLYNTTNADVTDNTFFNNSDTGLWVEGTSTVDAFSGNQFRANPQQIVYTNGAGATLDAGGISGNQFYINGAYKLTSDMNDDELFALEDQVTHKLDDGSNGFVSFKDGNVYVTQDSGSIQRGVDAASAGDTVNINDGTFNEAVNLNKSLTLDGQGATTVLDGAGLHTNGITVAANDVSLNDLTVQNYNIEDYLSGIYVDSSISNLTMDDVTSTGNTYAGFRVTTNGSIDGLTVSDSHFDNNNISVIPGQNDFGYGWLINKDMSALNTPDTVKNVTVTDTTFNGNSVKGIYAEKLSDATFTNIDVINSANRTTNPFGNVAVDINLKNGTYQNITFDNATVTGGGFTSGAKAGAGISVKARNDGATYSPKPALLTNLTIKNSTVDVTGGDVAVGVGNNVDGALIQNNTLTGPQGVTVYSGSRNVSVEGNTIHTAGNSTGTLDSAAPSVHGISFKDATGTNIVRDNTMDGVSTGSGVKLVNSTATVGETGHGNTITGYATGLNIDGTSTVSGFADNQFKDNATHIAYLNGSGADLDATGTSGNSFYINGAYKLTSDMTTDELLDLAALITDRMDDPSYGKVVLKTGSSYVTGGAGLQNAIDDADAGDTIEIDDSTYTGNYIINSSIAIHGHGSTFVADSSSPIFTILADGVTIDPITFDGAGVGAVGIASNGFDNITIDGNTFLNFTQNAIRLENGDNFAVTNNTIHDIGADGIYIGGSLNSNLAGNTLYNIGGNAIFATGTDALNVSGNTVTSSVLNNVWVANSTNATVADNTLSGTAAHTGVAVTNVTNADIHGNTISGSGYGFYADGNSTGIEAHDNSVSGITNLLVWNNGAPSTIDASGNWWGTTDEAAINGQMSGAVDFTPYLASGTDTDGLTAGFQGDASDVYVTTLGSQSGTDGRINEAIDTLADGSLTGGDRIVHVNAGTYNEAVNANKALTLSGAGSTTVIDGSGIHDNGITVAADDVSLDDMLVENFNVDDYLSGVYVDTSINNLAMDDITSTNNTYAGFRVTTNGSIDGLTVSNSHFDNNAISVIPGQNDFGYGWLINKDMSVLNAPDTVKNVTVTDTTFNGNANKGIYAEKLSDATFTNIDVINSANRVTNPFGNVAVDINLKNGTYQNITFDNATVTGSGLTSGAKAGAGISVKARNDGATYRPKPALLTNLTIKNSTVDVTGGDIAVGVGNNIDGALVQNNTLTGPQGVTVYGGSRNVTVEGNTINTAGASTGALDSAAPSVHGVSFTDATGTNIVRNNTMNGAGDGTGVKLTNSSGVTVGEAGNGNTIDGYTTGVGATGGTDLTIARNTINHSGDDGINVADTTGTVQISRNTVKNTDNGTDHYGITVSGLTNASINHNTITKGWDGISVTDSAGTQIASNDVDGVKNTGIALASGDSNTTVTKNTLTNSKQYGIYASDHTGTLDIKQNTVDGVTNRDGIAVSGSDAAAITGNTIDDTGRDGISVDGGTATIKNNTVGYGADGVPDTGDDSLIGRDAIRATHVSDADIRGNDVANALRHGLYLNATGGTNLVQGNEIDHVGGNGIMLVDSLDTNVYANAVGGLGSGATGDGIRVNGGNNINIGGTLAQGNGVALSGDNGIVVNTVTGDVVIRNNGVFGTLAGDGIKVVDTADADISQNAVGFTFGDGIHVNGADSTNAQIDANDVRYVNGNAIAVLGGATGADITDNHIRFADTGVYTTGDQDQISNNNIKHITNAAIDVSNDAAGGLAISGNTIADASYGIYAANVDDLDIENNDIRKIDNYGIFADGGTSADIILNTLHNIMGLVGIGLDGHDGAQVLNNTIDADPGKGPDIGIGLNDSNSALIDGNTVSVGSRAGIGLDTSDDAIITDNDVSDADDSDDQEDYGIALIDSNNAFVTGNTAANREVGVYVDPSDNVEVSFNTLDDNTVGVEFEDTTNSRILNNTIINSGETGILLTGSDGVTVNQNSVSDSGLYGLLASGDSNGAVSLSQNTFTNNPTGVRLESGLYDLTGGSNTIDGGSIGLQLAPATPASTLQLIGNTLGSTHFDNQSNYYIRLEDNAYYSGGTSFVIDAQNVFFNGFSPSNSIFGSGMLSLSQLQQLEALIFDLDDQVGRGQIFLGTVPGMADEDLFPHGLGTFGTPGGGFRVTILGLPTVPGTGGGNIASILNNLTPFAGGDDNQTAGNPSDLNNVEPAAGGTSSGSCWSDVADHVGQGSVSLQFGSSTSDSLNSGCS